MAKTWAEMMADDYNAMRKAQREDAQADHESCPDCPPGQPDCSPSPSEFQVLPNGIEHLGALEVLGLRVPVSARVFSGGMQLEMDPGDFARILERSKEIGQPAHGIKCIGGPPPFEMCADTGALAAGLEEARRAVERFACEEDCAVDRDAVVITKELIENSRFDLVAALTAKADAETLLGYPVVTKEGAPNPELQLGSLDSYRVPLSRLTEEERARLRAEWDQLHIGVRDFVTLNPDGSTSSILKAEEQPDGAARSQDSSINFTCSYSASDYQKLSEMVGACPDECPACLLGKHLMQQEADKPTIVENGYAK